MRKVLSLTVLFVAVMASLTITSTADAATRTWTGTSDGHWNVPANWGGTLPVAGDDLVFPASGLNQTMINDLPAGTLFRSLSLAGEYTLTGAAIVLGDGGIQYNPPNGSSVNTIGVAITLGVAQTWGTLEQGLNIAGSVHLNGHSLTVDADWGRPLTISGVIDGTGAIVKN